MTPNISAQDLRRAATIKDEIESLQSELSKILNGGGGRAGNATGGGKGRRKMSASAKAKIAAAARARWAKAKAAGKRRL